MTKPMATIPTQAELEAKVDALELELTEYVRQVTALANKEIDFRRGRIAALKELLAPPAAPADPADLVAPPPAAPDDGDVRKGRKKAAL